MDVEQRMAQYVQVREILRAEGKVWKEREALLKNILDRIEGEFGAFMKETNQDNLTSASGTAYTSEVWSATVADAEALRAFVKETGKFDLLKMAANPTTVRAYVAENNALPPGVNLSSLINVNVRKA
jgi:hypothetical protein